MLRGCYYRRNIPNGPKMHQILQPLGSESQSLVRLFVVPLKAPRVRTMYALQLLVACNSKVKAVFPSNREIRS